MRLLQRVGAEQGKIQGVVPQEGPLTNTKLNISFYRSLDVKFAEERQKLEVASTYS